MKYFIGLLSCLFFICFSGGLALNSAFADQNTTDDLEEDKLLAPSLNFSEDYRTKNEGKAEIVIPEVYELANIITALTQLGQEGTFTIFKESTYYDEVWEHFSDFQNHPAVVNLGLGGENFDYLNYYYFRDNGYAYKFDSENKLVPTGVYQGLWDQGLDEIDGHFGHFLPLVEDFAEKTEFRKFYQEHLGYYQQQIDYAASLLDLKGMWTWLEERFPTLHYNQYSVVFSPLIYGSHSADRQEDQGFKHSMMFVSGPINTSDLPEDKLRARYERTVFTEIDHNYVNPISDLFVDEINEALKDLAVWGSDKYYDNPYRVFNEYMTWGVFILYAYETYEPEVFQYIYDHVAQQMLEDREFYKYPEFQEFLLNLHKEKASQEMKDYFPAALQWMANNSGKGM